MSLTDKLKSDYTNIILLTEELLKEGFIIQINVGGYSMFPYLRKGNTIFIKKESINTLKTGDVIVFRSVNKMIAHRIISIRKKNSQVKILTKGDSLGFFDKPMTEERYIGKIIEIYRNDKTILIDTPIHLLLNKLIALISVISIPFFITLIPLTFSFHFFKTHLILNKK